MNEAPHVEFSNLAWLAALLAVCLVLWVGIGLVFWEAWATL